MRRLDLGLEEIQEVIDFGDDSELTVYGENEFESSGATDVLESAIETASEAAVGLEEIKEALELSLTNGGLTEQGALFANIAIKNTVAAGYGVAKPLPSMESINSNTGRMQITGFALETVNKEAEGIFARIKAFIQKWIQKVVEFWNKYISNVGRLVFSAKKLATKAREHKGVVKEKEIELSGALLENLQINSEINFSKIIAGIKSLETTVNPKNSETIALILEQTAEKLSNFDVSTVEKAEALKTILDGEIFSSDHEIAQWKSGGWTESTYKQFLSTNTVTYLVTPKLIGDKINVVEIKNDLSGRTTGIKVALKDIPGVGRLIKAQKVKALTPDEIETAANAVVSIAGHIVSFKNVISEREKIVNNIVKSAEKLSSKLEKTNLEASKTETYVFLKFYLSSIPAIAQATVAPILDAQKVATGSSRSLYDYAVYSYKNLGEKSTDKKD